MATVRKRTWAGGAKSAWACEYTDLAGKRRRKTFKSKHAADRYRQSVEGELAAGTHTAPRASITVERAVKQFLDDHKKRVTRGTPRSYGLPRPVVLCPGRYGAPRLSAAPPPCCHVAYCNALISRCPGWAAGGPRWDDATHWGLARPLVRLLTPLGWGATPTGLRTPLTPLLALSALLRLLSPTTPLPVIHAPADRDAAPQAAGNRRRVRMRCGTLPGSELISDRDERYRGLLESDFGGGASDLLPTSRMAAGTFEHAKDP